MDNKSVGNDLVNIDEVKESAASGKDSNLINEENINNIDFLNPVHEFENLEPPAEPEYKKYTKIGIIVLAVIVIIFVLYLIINSIVRASHDKVCIPIENNVIETSFEYAKENNLLPINEGESIVVKIEDLLKDGILSKNNIRMKKSVCSGSVKITKYKEDYIKTFDLTNCGYCTTDKRYKKWSKETTKEQSGKNMVLDVEAYYNYKTYEDYNSQWTVYIKESLINKEVSKEYGIAMPIDNKYLPVIPKEAEILKVYKEDKTYYSFRDKKWKFYRDNGGVYSTEFYSEQPQGYAKKDESTLKFTEWSEWSLNYPDKKNYRNIKSSYGYKWYYLDKKEKKYWNNGAYSVEQPSEKYVQKDKDSKEIMYSYQDKTWLWYNGNKRGYTGYFSVSSNGLIKDENFIQYTNWSDWKEISYLSESSSIYREQKTTTSSRYRIQYRMYSYLNFENHLNIKEFEKETNSSLTDFLKREKTTVDIIYKFKYRKR